MNETSKNWNSNSLRQVIKRQTSDLFDLSRTDSRYRRYENPDEPLKELRKDVWRVLIDRMEVRRIGSVKGNEELNSQIENGEDLPDMDEAQISLKPGS